MKEILTCALFLCLSWAGQSRGDGCGPGWIPSPHYCYLFVNTSAVTWSQAEVECELQQASLLRVETHDELLLVVKNAGATAGDGWWTALNLVGTDWLWDKDEVASQITWNQEPDNADDEDCCAIDTQGHFSDERCGKKMGYICELNAYQDGGCPTFWLIGTANSDCFYVSNATTPDQLKTWDEANTFCSSWQPDPNNPNKAYLVSLDNPTDTAFFNASIPSWTQTTRQYWTALNDRMLEGNYVWGPNDPLNPNTILWVSEPDNVAGRETCGLLQDEGTFSDRDCNQRQNYICRKPIPTGVSQYGDLGCGSWIRAGHKCYFPFDNPSTWSAARQQCQGYGGDLMKIESRDEARWLEIQSRTAQLATGGYWIGLNDQANENHFVWADGSASDNSFLNWNVEPNDFNGDEDCAVMSQDGVFSDWPCTNRKAGYICEKDAVNGACPQGWVARGGTECYYISRDRATANEARDKCYDKSGDATGYLFALNSQEEKDWLLAQVAPLNKAPLFWWSSLTDSAVEGVWSYTRVQDQNPAFMAFVVWNSEPNDYQHNEDCVNVVYGGRLNDYKCNSQIGFICEKAAGSGVMCQASLLLLLLCSLISIFIS